MRDILAELEKPGRDPRPEFRTAAFRAGVETLKDLAPGMTLEGVVTNVTNFGAFVDIGVHQDGLVRILKVLDVDLQRKRIALTMRMDAETEHKPHAGHENGQRSPGNKPKDARPSIPRNAPRERQPATGSALAAAFARARRK